MYYYGHGANVNRFGGGNIIPVPASIGGQSDGRFARGRRFNDEQEVFTMLNGTTIHDIGNSTICMSETFSAFFTRIEFPTNIVIPGGGSGGGEDNRNCVSLSNQLQLSWTIKTTVANPMVTFTLCGCLLTDGYMSLGLSGNTDSVNMVNGDVTVAWMDTQAHADDYFLQRREQVGCTVGKSLWFGEYSANPKSMHKLALIYYSSYCAQCRAGIGVCSDKVSTAGSTCKEDNFDVSGSVNNGVTCVTYSRFLDTGT